VRDPRERANKEIDRLTEQLERGLISREEFDSECRDIEREVGEWEREMDRRDEWDAQRGIDR
jgi:hypothetical protein